MTPPDSSPPLLPPPTAQLCLDFANTSFWRGTAVPEETLRAPDDLLAWLAGAGQPGTEDARAHWNATPGAAEAAHRTALDLRETIYRVLAGPDPTPGDLAALNRALAAAPERRHLERTVVGFAWRAAPWSPTPHHLLAPVLWSAADLLAGPRRARVHTCANPRCRWLFLDDSKAGTRRWCSMASCGNRAKAHRHYVRTRARPVEGT
jgi:predicted RNA-binding Zn ribbon-like protein